MLRARKPFVMSEINVPGSAIISEVGVDELVLDEGVQVVEAIFSGRNDRNERKTRVGA
jgi:hypothetical protein